MPTFRGQVTEEQISLDRVHQVALAERGRPEKRVVQ